MRKCNRHETGVQAKAAAGPGSMWWLAPAPVANPGQPTWKCRKHETGWKARAVACPEDKRPAWEAQTMSKSEAKPILATAAVQGTVHRMRATRAPAFVDFWCQTLQVGAGAGCKSLAAHAEVQPT
ncbi:hypothetical protein Pelo_19766 [Pelomyxa schiedti]|nr:hypothetical protein Pelo_19766 [Pelomyxa schiedti]